MVTDVHGQTDRQTDSQTHRYLTHMHHNYTPLPYIRGNGANIITMDRRISFLSVNSARNNVQASVERITLNTVVNYIH